MVCERPIQNRCSWFTYRFLSLRCFERPLQCSIIIECPMFLVEIEPMVSQCPIIHHNNPTYHKCLQLASIPIPEALARKEIRPSFFSKHPVLSKRPMAIRHALSLMLDWGKGLGVATTFTMCHSQICPAIPTSQSHLCHSFSLILHLEQDWIEEDSRLKGIGVHHRSMAPEVIGLVRRCAQLRGLVALGED